MEVSTGENNSSQDQRSSYPYLHRLLLFTFLAFGFSLLRWALRKPGLSIPRVGTDPKNIFALNRARKEFMKDGKRIVEEGYAKYKSSMFIVQTADMERIILSNKYADELRSRPQSVLNSKAAQSERHLAWWNTLDVVKKSDLHVNVFKSNLNQHLAKLVNGLAEEAELGCSEELQQCNFEDFHFIPGNQLAFNLVARIVNRAIVGVPTCRNKEWFGAATGWATEAFAISGALRPWAPVLRPFVYCSLGARRRLKQHVATANRILRPEIEQRRREKGNRLDLLQWMIDGAKGTDREPKELTHKTLFLCLASIFSSTMGITHALFDLCAYPEYVDELRQEVESVRQEEGGWTLAGVQRMHKLDSFLRESQRVNHPGMFSFNRKVLQDLQLSDGCHVPAGSFISMPTYCFARDPEYYESPEIFSPLRFYKARLDNPDTAARQQFTATGKENMPWGYGNSACPGRTFAACEMKLALAVLLCNYDFTFPDGQTRRPENVHIDERIWPSRTQKVGFRQRRVLPFMD